MISKIELKSVAELNGMNFVIPNYQRGYRWTKQQVEDLLVDIHEFIDKSKTDNENDNFYCLQPLVVKESIEDTDKSKFIKALPTEASNNPLADTREAIQKYIKYEVIDGQQRLTTIFIICKVLEPNKEPFNLSYATRPESAGFLKTIAEEKAEEVDNIDFHFMSKAKEAIEGWFKEKEEKEIRKKFKSTLFDKVKFIWYEAEDKDPIKIFTRLNIGKISLTNAELIKALFLNRSNFPEKDYHYIRLKQQEIANQWDEIEFTLQNEEFWLFLNKKDYDKPTRIDMIFDIICEQDRSKKKDEDVDDDDIGNDHYRTFRYFYKYFKSKDYITCWEEVRKIFQIFQEWYNDLELYHYIGYLLTIEDSNTLSELLNLFLELEEVDKDKEQFLGRIKEKIKKTLPNEKDLNKSYETEENKEPKTNCRPILLLHNVQTVINQNRHYEQNENYKLRTFYKFPFHLYKLENWDVEHIAPSTDNDLSDNKSQIEWLKNTSLSIQEKILREKITNIIETNSKQQESKQFEELYNEIILSIGGESSFKDNDKDKNKLWNFTLLDSSTNRAYKNALFPSKRRWIMGKDQGKFYEISNDLKVEEKPGQIAFVPPCTKNVFMKYYTPVVTSLHEWTKEDAEAYLGNIKTVLKEFLPETNETK